MTFYKLSFLNKFFHLFTFIILLLKLRLLALSFFSLFFLSLAVGYFSSYFFQQFWIVYIKILIAVYFIFLLLFLFVMNFMEIIQISLSNKWRQILMIEKKWQYLLSKLSNVFNAEWSFILIIINDACTLSGL